MICGNFVLSLPVSDESILQVTIELFTTLIIL